MSYLVKLSSLRTSRPISRWKRAWGCEWCDGDVYGPLSEDGDGVDDANDNLACPRCGYVHTFDVDYDGDPVARLTTERLRPYWLHRALRATVPAATYDRVRRTRTVPIRYVRGRPEWNLPQDCGTNDKLIIILVICMCLNFAAICGVVLAVHFRRARRELFARQGELVQAPVG